MRTVILKLIKLFELLYTPLNREEGVVMSLSVNIAAFRLISREISRDLGEKEIKRKRGRALAGEHFYYTRNFKTKRSF